MRHTLFASLFALLVAAPTSARADILVTPYLGVNFGGNQPLCSRPPCEARAKRVNVGASLTWLSSSGLGFEVDLGFIPDFFEPKNLEIDVLGANNVTTLMGNVVFGKSVGGLQPYVSAGGGLLRSQVGTFGGIFDDIATDNGLGVNAGAGLRVGGGRLSLRGDVRYFRTVTGVDPLLEDVLGDFAFWRAAAGLSVGF